MKRVGDLSRVSLLPFSSLLYPLFRPSVLSPTPFPALIREDSVLYNLILQSRAAVKAADFTSRRDAHIYMCTLRVYTETRARGYACRLRDLRYSFLTALYPDGKFPSCTKKPT